MKSNQSDREARKRNRSALTLRDVFLGFTRGVYAVFEKRFFTWVDRRIFAENQHTLSRKKLYIFPSKRGFAYIAIVFILWLLGTNYQNNLILALAFLLTSVFVIAILHTHNNLASLKIEYTGASPTFAGDDVAFTFLLSTPAKHFTESVEMAWLDGDDMVVNIDVDPLIAISVQVPQMAKRRGWQKPGRMLVQSYFPLGLLRCWSWLSWDVAALIYPQPQAIGVSNSRVADVNGEGVHPVSGGDDYSGLKSYQPGDSMKHIAWKAFAQERGLYVKEFSQNVSQERWLDFNDISVTDVEGKLSAMCHWALYFCQNDEYFGVKLPGIIIDPDKGENHRRRVLEELARYEG